MTDRISALRWRISVLEAELNGEVCSCRPRDVTAYHTAADLVAIMSVACPVHGAGDLGLFVWLPPSSPLRTEDRALCSCPPCAAREWREGRREPLSEAEEKEEYRSLGRADERATKAGPET